MTGRTVVGSIISLSALMVAASCAAMTKKAITKEDLPALKGKREGVRTVGGGTTANTDLEIYNDTGPLKGKLAVHNVIVRGAPGRTVNLEFQDGLIEARNLVIRKEKNDCHWTCHFFCRV